MGGDIVIKKHMEECDKITRKKRTENTQKLRKFYKAQEDKKEDRTAKELQLQLECEQRKEARKEAYKEYKCLNDFYSDLEDIQNAIGKTFSNTELEGMHKKQIRRIKEKYGILNGNTPYKEYKCRPVAEVTNRFPPMFSIFF